MISAPTSCGGYHLVQEIGRGGTGVVYAAQHAANGKRVAVKLLLPALSRSRQAVARFFHEARSVASVHDAGIVDVYDSGYAEDGSAYIAMELLQGESLAARLARSPALPLSQLRYIGLEVARTVGAAHARQIVHRDLKPDNVFLARGPQLPFGLHVKVLDFGMAKLNPDEGPYSFVTDKGALVGTPMYMSPEQCRGGEVDARSDVYALGCMLYEMACGRPPFVKGGVGLILGAHVYEKPRPARELRPSLPEPLSRLLMCALAKQPEQRQQSMRALALELSTMAGLDD